MGEALRHEAEPVERHTAGDFESREVEKFRIAVPRIVVVEPRREGPEGELLAVRVGLAPRLVKAENQKRGPGFWRMNRPASCNCSQGVAAFMAKFAKLPPNDRSSRAGSTSLIVEVPKIAESKRALRTTCGYMNRWFTSMSGVGACVAEARIPKGSSVRMNP